MTTFNVSGTAERYSPPERAVVQIRITYTSLKRGEPYRAVTDTHNSLVEFARSFKESGAATWFDASAPSTYSYQEYYRPAKNADQKTRMRYAAASRISVKFKDFEELGEWIADLADQEHVSISVDWRLTEATSKQILKEIRGEAVANARSLAEDYARGDGIEISDKSRLKLVSVADSSGGYRESFSPLRSAAAPMAGGSAPRAQISPEDIQLSASIAAVFEI